MNTQELIHALIPVVREAGAKIMVVYAQGGGADFKADGSPVTEADQAAEAVILAALARLAPHIPVISEENAASHALAAPERFFLVDPLDGTKEFLKRDGQGAFTVNIGLIDGGVPVAGLVYAPALDRLLVQRDVMQRLFHGGVRVAKELLEQVYAQHHLCGKRRPTGLTRWRVRCNQRQQLRPRDHHVHLIKELPLARALGDQFKPSGGKTHLFHDSTVSDQAVTGLTFADLP
jgi:3'-phosphoadenosine 5'-phosphosulfate (PAPS) 3'-phosphatase